MQKKNQKMNPVKEFAKQIRATGWVPAVIYGEKNKILSQYL